MTKSLSIFRRDLLRLLRNPIALMIALGICVVPCLYAWINIAANWDPYENTSDIRVAVVNEDTSQSLPGMGDMCVGDMLVEKLAENDAIGWQFVGEDEALENVRSGKFYAAIIIPDDFTKSLTGILNGHIEKAHLKYYVNEKVNAIAPKVTDTGASTIESQVGSQFISTAGGVIAEKLGGVTSKLADKAEKATTSIANALSEARTKLDGVDSKLGDVSTKLENATKALQDAADKLSGYDGKGAETSDALNDVLNNFENTRENARNLLSDINSTLGDGASAISELSSQANYDVSSIAGDIAAAQSEVDAAIRALETDLTDNKALTGKIKQTIDVDISSTSDSSKTVFVDLQDELNKEYDAMVQITDAEQAKIDELRAIGDKLKTAADEVRGFSQSINNKVQDSLGIIQNAQNSAVSTSLLQVSEALDTYVSIAQQLSTAMRGIDPIISQIVTIGRELSSTLDQADNALAGTRMAMGDLTSDLAALEGEISAIQASQEWELLKGYTTTNPEGVKDFLSAPVTINENRLYPMANYASGVAPFFTSLALWVGGIALVAIFKLEVDEEEVGKVRPWQAYFGRWLLFVLLGILQAIICCTGDLFLGIQCDYPIAFFLSAIVASFSFVNIIFALSVAFKHLGKALAFTLIILQVPGSSGMYPIEMMPPFFQAIGPWLPFTYSNNAMREAIAGFYGTNLAHNILMLLLFVVPSLLIGVSARSHLVNINSLFDRRLRETDHLMVSEPVAIEDDRFRLATVVKAIRAPQEYREIVERRSASFEKAYPKLVRRGVIALFAVPLCLFALALALDAKLPIVGCLVVFLVCVYAFLIVVEYFHDRIARKKALTDLSPGELDDVLADTLRDELMPYASIDALLEMRGARQEKKHHGKLLQHIEERSNLRHKTEADAEVSEGGDEQ